MDLIVDEMNVSLQISSNAIEDNLKKIVEIASKVLANMSKEFRKDMKELLKDIIENLKHRDALYFKRFQDHKEAVLANENTIKTVIDKVYELNSSLNEFKSMIMQRMKQTVNALERTNSTMALVYQQREQADTRL